MNIQTTITPNPGAGTFKNGFVTYTALPYPMPAGATVRLQQLGQQLLSTKPGPEYDALTAELAELDAELRDRYGVPVCRPAIASVAPVQEAAR